MEEFKEYELRIVEPTFSSSLTDSIIDLDHLRKRQLGGTTHPKIFFQLKSVFHLLESIGSARIEGNNTTISEYIETKIDSGSNQPIKPLNENLLEIANVERAMTFIEVFFEDGLSIDQGFIEKIHQIVVEGLKTEGDRTPGKFRTHGVKIKGSNHLPPDALHVHRYFGEMLAFMSEEKQGKYDLLRTALVHHRFTWIHPFSNGNGRVVRLLTYAMLISQGFKVNHGRILNPTAVFCNNRDEYYRMLSEGDKGTDEGLLAWCTYVLEGLNVEISKVDKLSDHRYLEDRILLPALKFCRKQHYITLLDFNILKIAIHKKEFQSSDIKTLMPKKVSAERSRVLASLKERKLIAATKEGGRKYVIQFSNNYLLRGVIDALKKEGFVALQE